MRLSLPDDRFARAFWGMIAATFVLTAIFAWQAVESQEVKGSLKGGLDPAVEVDSVGLFSVGDVGASYVNEGDQTVTLEGVGLVATEDVKLIRAVARDPETAAEHELDGFDVDPGESVEVIARFEVNGTEGEIEALRLHYRAGGRAGQTVG